MLRAVHCAFILEKKECLFFCNCSNLFLLGQEDLRCDCFGSDMYILGTLVSRLYIVIKLYQMPKNPSKRLEFKRIYDILDVYRGFHFLRH